MLKPGHRLIENRIHVLVVGRALAALGGKKYLGEYVHFGLQIYARGIQFGFDLVKSIRVDLLAHDGAFIILAECLLNLVRVVYKVEDKRIVFQGMGAIEA